MKFPYAEVQLEKSGALHDPAERDAAAKMIADTKATDVLVLVHGWNNDMEDARKKYATLSDNIADLQNGSPPTIAVIGVLWPSVQWADPDQIAGGGAGVPDEATALATDLQQRIEDPVAAEQLAKLVPRLEASASARAEYLKILRSLLPVHSDSGEDAIPSTFVQGDPEEVFSAVNDAGDGLSGDAASGGAQNIGSPTTLGSDQGGAAAFGFDDLLGAARKLLNLTTYYTMRDRSGDIGRVGLSELLESVQPSSSPRVHLVGHSFGARAVTQAAAVTNAKISSLTLLQGAFSHFGMATDWDDTGSDGEFRVAPTRLRGPALVTFTRNDRVIGIAYAIASRLARQSGSGVGGPNDPYGGIGANGALKTVDSDTKSLLDVSETYEFPPKRVANLKSDKFISGHSDVTGIQVAHAILSAVTAVENTPDQTA